MPSAVFVRIIQDRAEIKDTGYFLLVLPEAGGYELIALTEEEKDLVVMHRARRMAQKTSSNEPKTAP